MSSKFYSKVYLKENNHLLFPCQLRGTKTILGYLLNNKRGKTYPFFLNKVENRFSSARVSCPHQAKDLYITARPKYLKGFFQKRLDRATGTIH